MTILTLIVGLLIFLIPANLFLKLGLSQAYVNGLLIDYLIPKLYLTDLVLIGLLIFWALTIFWKKKSLKIKRLQPQSIGLVILWIIIGLHQLLVSKPVAAIYQLIKITEVFGLGIFLLSQPKVWRQSLVFVSLIAGLIFQSLLASYQFLTQQSLGGYFLLGEPNIQTSFGMPKAFLLGAERNLPFGTTTHPNVLAGVLVIFWLMVTQLFQQQKQKNWLKISFMAVATGLTLIALYLTQAVSAWLMLLIGLIWLIKPQLKARLNLRLATALLIATAAIMPLLLNFWANQYPKNQSFARRNILNQASWQIWLKNPWLGVGLNNFTAQLENYLQSGEVVRFVQPVHHLGLLLLTELGLLGTAGLIWLIKVVLQQFNFSRQQRQNGWAALLTLLPVMTLDHYLITQQIGLLLLIVWLSFAVSNPQTKN